MKSSSQEKITMQDTASTNRFSNSLNNRASQISQNAPSVLSQLQNDAQPETYSSYTRAATQGRPDLQKMCDLINGDYDIAWESKLAIVDFSLDEKPAFKEVDISETTEALKATLTERPGEVGLRLVILYDSFGDYRSKKILNLLAETFELDPFDLWQHCAGYRGGAYLPSERSTSPLEIVVTNGIGTARCHTDEVSGNKTVVLLWDVDQQEVQNPHLADDVDLYCTRGFPKPSRSATQPQSPSTSADIVVAEEFPDYRSSIGRTKLMFSAISSSDVNASIRHPIMSLMPVISRGLIDHSQLLHRSTNLSMTRQHRYSNYRDNANFEARQSFFANGMYQKLLRCVDSMELHRMSPWIDGEHESKKAVDDYINMKRDDHGSLIGKVEFLKSLIENQATRNLGLQSVEEAKLSLQQAKSVTRLTRLAFVFIPLSFATSVFGMNIRGWQDGDAPRIGSFAIFAVIATVLTILFAWVTTIWDNYRQLQIVTDQSYWSQLVRQISWKSKLLAVFFVLYSMFHSAEKTRELAQALGIEIHGAAWDGSRCDRYLDLHQVDPMEEFWRKLGHPVFERWRCKRRADIESLCTAEN